MVKHIDLMLSSLLDFLQRVHQALTLKPALTETSMFTSLGLTLQVSSGLIYIYIVISMVISLYLQFSIVIYGYL